MFYIFKKIFLSLLFSFFGIEDSDSQFESKENLDFDSKVSDQEPEEQTKNSYFSEKIWITLFFSIGVIITLISFYTGYTVPTDLPTIMEYMKILLNNSDYLQMAQFVQKLIDHPKAFGDLLFSQMDFYKNNFDAKNPDFYRKLCDQIVKLLEEYLKDENDKKS